MLAAIQLNDKHFIQAYEVYDVIPDGLLAAKSDAQLIILHLRPEQPLGVGLIPPQLTGQLGWQLIVFDTPSPLWGFAPIGLSLQGRGEDGLPVFCYDLMVRP